MVRLDVIQRRHIGSPVEVESMNNQMAIISRQIADLRSKYIVSKESCGHVVYHCGDYKSSKIVTGIPCCEIMNIFVSSFYQPFFLVQTILSLYFFVCFYFFFYLFGLYIFLSFSYFLVSLISYSFIHSYFLLSVFLFVCLCFILIFLYF